MHRWVGKVAMVTGSSSGIGESIAGKLVEQGVKVVGVARRKQKLEDIANNLSNKKGTFFPFAADVSKEEDLLNAFKWTKENVGPVSILVNNAGVIKKAYLSESPTSYWKDVLNTNVIGYCIATREAIKHMKESKVDGHIINMNSIVGHRIPSLPMFNNYTASKHAISALTETLRLELGALGSKIKVTSLSPGNVRSEILNNTNMNEEQLKRLKNLIKLEPDDVADAALYVLSTAPHVQIPEMLIQVMGEKH